MLRNILLLFIMVSIGANAQSQSYEISFKIKGLENRGIAIAYHYADDVYILDSVFFDDNAQAVFKGEKLLPQGMYIVVLSNDVYFDFFITDNQKFTIKSSLPDITQHLSFIQSPVNTAFYEFQHYMRKRAAEAAKLRIMKEKTDSPEELSNIEKRFNEINDEVNSYRKKMLKEFEGSLFANFIRTTIDVEIPENSETKSDSMFAYNYYRQHYLDHLPLNDARLIRTPVFAPKVLKYITEIIPQHPDTVITEIDMLLSECENNPDVYRILLGAIQNHYNNGRYAGSENIFVHLAKNYYLSGKTPWSSQEYLNTLQGKVEQLEKSLIGSKATDIVMLQLTNDTSKYSDLKGLLNVTKKRGLNILENNSQTEQDKIINKFIHIYNNYLDNFGEYTSLHQVDADYTILWFWEPSCTHCRAATPKLRDLYQKYKANGVEVYAVNIEAAPFLIPDYFFEKPTEKWKNYIKNMHLWYDFIKANKLYEWINVYDPYESSQFRDYYHIVATPSVYLLDSEKKIIAKNISIEGLNTILTELVEDKLK